MANHTVQYEASRSCILRAVYTAIPERPVERDFISSLKVSSWLMNLLEHEPSNLARTKRHGLASPQRINFSKTIDIILLVKRHNIMFSKMQDQEGEAWQSFESSRALLRSRMKISICQNPELYKDKWDNEKMVMHHAKRGSKSQARNVIKVSGYRSDIFWLQFKIKYQRLSKKTVKEPRATVFLPFAQKRCPPSFQRRGNGY